MDGGMDRGQMCEKACTANVNSGIDLGRFLTGVQLELHLGHIVKEFGKVSLNL